MSESVKKATPMNTKLAKYGCLMIELGIDNWEKLNGFIKPSDIYGTRKDGYGMVINPHVTILFGFHEFGSDVIEKLKKELPINGSISLEISGVDFFETKDFDVVKFCIESPELDAMNKWCCDNFEYSNDYDYKPHMTIAYVNKGTGKDYVRKSKKRIELSSNHLYFSAPDKKKTKWVAR